MKTISPQVPTVIDLSLNNPADTATYYVQAVVKDKLSGATLLTQNLTDNGNHYFSGKWTTPQDPTGQGRELLVITTVYTDAGYSVISDAYGAIYDTWIVQARPQFYGGGGFPAEIDYAKIEALIEAKLNTLPAPIEPEAVDLSPVLKRIDELETVLPVMEDINPSLEKLKAIINEMSSLMESHRTMIASQGDDAVAKILEASHNGQTALADISDKAHEHLRTHVHALTEIASGEMKRNVKETREGFAGALKDAMSKTIPVSVSVATPRPPKEEQPAPPHRTLHTLLT